MHLVYRDNNVFILFIVCERISRITLQGDIRLALYFLDDYEQRRIRPNADTLGNLQLLFQASSALFAKLSSLALFFFIMEKDFFYSSREEILRNRFIVTFW